MVNTHRPRTRPRASRWLWAIAPAAVFCLVVPAFAAAAESAVVDTPPSATPGTPAGEVSPGGDTTAPATPADGSGGTATEPPTATDGGATEPPAPPPSETPVNEPAPVPGPEATPTPAPAPSSDTPVVPTPLPVTPDTPVQPTTSTPLPPAPQTPADRIAAVTPVVPSVSASPTSPPPASKPDAAAPITDLFTPLLDPAALANDAGPISPIVSAPAAPVAPDGFSAEETVELTVPTFVAPIGPAPAGSSLLAVLAGYVLPGSSGPPASTLVMLIVIGLILGVGYAARPQLTEALASQRLLGASSGHGMAVRRPG